MRQSKLKAMCQKKIVTLNNFWDYTFGVWEHLDCNPKPEWYIDSEIISKSEESIYWHRKSNPSVIYRESNHWGGGIGTCNWYLQGYPIVNSYSFKEQFDGEVFVGAIDLKYLQRMIPQNVEWKDWNRKINDSDHTKYDEDMFDNNPIL